jgi:hypothetical protein
LLSHLWQQGEFVEAVLCPPAAALSTTLSAALWRWDGPDRPSGGSGWDGLGVADRQHPRALS